MDWKSALVMWLRGLEFLPLVEVFKGNLEASINEKREKFLISERDALLNLLKPPS